MILSLQLLITAAACYCWYRCGLKRGYLRGIKDGYMQGAKDCHEVHMQSMHRITAAFEMMTVPPTKRLEIN